MDASALFDLRTSNEWIMNGTSLRSWAETRLVSCASIASSNVVAERILARTSAGANPAVPLMSAATSRFLTHEATSDLAALDSTSLGIGKISLERWQCGRDAPLLLCYA